MQNVEHHTVDTLKRKYRDINPAGHWFDPSSMRFFASRIGQVHQVGQVWLFVSSEQFHGSQHSDPRMYTVRRMDADGEITDVGGFQNYTRSTVRAAIKHAVSKESEVLV